MVAALEFDNLVSPGVSAGEPNGGHCGFGATVDHAYFFDGGDKLDNELCQLNFVGVGRAEAGTVLERGGDGFAYDLVVVPVDGGSPGAYEIDQRFVVRGGEGSALGLFGEKRGAAPGLKLTPLAFGVGRRIPIVQRYVS